jgi:hypothetical protein
MDYGYWSKKCPILFITDGEAICAEIVKLGHAIFFTQNSF